jgi:hypothetical protein
VLQAYIAILLRYKQAIPTRKNRENTMHLNTERVALTPEAYNWEEAKGRAGLPNRVIEAFQPQVFNTTGYPVHVDHTQDLWRYVDVMHETRLKSTVEDLLQGLTPSEFELFRRAVTFMIEFTTATFGRPLRCENALMRAMSIFRYIRAAKPRSVMEFGPGSGYLGLLHILDGIQYIGIENTQAFYLLQNLLWTAATGGKFCELATGTQTLRDAAAHISEYRALHVPWWKTVEFDLDNPPVSVDLTTANHCLVEMHANAMKYYTRLAYAALKGNHGQFIFEGWGYELLRSRGIVTREFDLVGFRMCHVEERVVGFSSDHQITDFMKLPRKRSYREKLCGMQRRVIRMESVPFGYEIESYSAPNSISTLIRDTQKKVRTTATVTYDDVLDFLADVYGKMAANDEECFLRLIGKTYL